VNLASEGGREAPAAFFVSFAAKTVPNDARCARILPETARRGFRYPRLPCISSFSMRTKPGRSLCQRPRAIGPFRVRAVKAVGNLRPPDSLPARRGEARRQADLHACPESPKTFGQHIHRRRVDGRNAEAARREARHLALNLGLKGGQWLGFGPRPNPESAPVPIRPGVGN
jgi:hypothetical protein